MYVIIAGGGRTGTQLARFLITEEHEVHVIENRPNVLALLHREIPSEMIHEGNPVDPLVLEQAGIKKAQVIAAVTTNDEDNLVICYMARMRYNIERTIARINNPRNSWLFSDVFHVDVAVNQSEIMAHLIGEEMSMGDMMTLAKIRRGHYSLFEEKILPGAFAIGKSVQDLNLLDTCVIAAILRQGEVVAPRGATTFQEGDEVLAVADIDGARQLEQLLTPAKNHNHA
ncbi:MAG: NAD-binding protein [Anaerolineae bacterium]|nr:NAD-binding protein [Anaerolineae bacterium]